MTASLEPIKQAVHPPDFHIIIGPVSADITQRTLDWMQSHRMFGNLDNVRAYQKQALVAATFGCRCVPSRANNSGRLRASKFTAIFLYLDAMTGRDVMSDQRWHAFHASLMDLLEGREVEEEHAALAEWLGELPEGGQDGAFALHDFQASLRDYCLSLNEARNSDLAAMSEEAFLALRRRTSFVMPYLDHWRVFLGIDVPREDPFRPTLEAAQAAARDLIILSNDLGSLVRDSTPGSIEKNIVLHHAQHHDVSRDVAAMWAVDTYNHRLHDLRRLLVCAYAPATSWQAPLANLLEGVVDGNLDTLLALEERYSRSDSWVRRLYRIRL
ncbi:MAG TPA: terpene synthase family protein [Chthonomonadaceae bacterium]|nr:terpene synthase family protein [Chthonomonadaceae bacterium]